MTTPGYPDYARLSQQGGVQLYFFAGTPAYNTTLFKGYVGSWPFLNLFTDPGVSVDFARLILVWYSDPAFTNVVGFRYAIRSGGGLAATQYANLGAWFLMFYDTTSGSPFPFLTLGLFAAVGAATSLTLQSNDVPIGWDNPTVAAGATYDKVVARVTPGPGNFYLTAPANTYTLRVKYYDYGSGTFRVLFVAQGSQYGLSPTFELPMFDAPCEVEISNTGAAGATYTWSWLGAE